MYYKSAWKAARLQLYIDIRRYQELQAVAGVLADTSDFRAGSAALGSGPHFHAENRAFPPTFLCSMKDISWATNDLIFLPALHTVEKKVEESTGVPSIYF
jgi:hypothetical protein